MTITEAAIAYVKELFRNDSGGHDTAHTLRVYGNALEIAGQEPGCDLEIVSLAALLHDADDHKLFDTKDNANARSFLTGQGVEAERIARILAAVNSVSFSRNRGKRPETMEGKIVQDADRLDAIGAVGIARTFAYGGEHGRSLDSSIEHFHEKLLLLKEEMNTQAGRRMAEARHRYMVGFLAEYELEMQTGKGRLPAEEETRRQMGDSQEKGRVYYSRDGLTIRDMRQSDPQVITEGEIAQGWHQTTEKYEMRLRHQAEGKAIALVAEYRGDVAGYINVYPDSPWGAFAGRGYPEIVDFGVLEKYRRRGIGTKLMDAAEQIAARYSDTVYLGVGMHSGYGSAQRMYVRRGYIPDGTGVWYKGSVCAPYDPACENDDELVLYLSKKLRG